VSANQNFSSRYCVFPTSKGGGNYLSPLASFSPAL
jgi:hypothetical protein